MDDVEIPDAAKILLLQNNILKTWHNTYFVATANAKIAQVLGDDKMLNQAKSNMSRALQAISVVSEMIEKLSENTNGS